MRKFYVLTYFCMILCSCIKSPIEIEQKEEQKEKEFPPKNLAVLSSFRINSLDNPTIDKDIVFRIYDNCNITAYATSEFSLKELKASFEIENGTLYIGETEQESGITKNDFSKKLTYNIIGDDGKKIAYTVHLVPYTGLPVVTIVTNGEKTMNKETWLPGYMTIDGMGMFENYSDSLDIKGRGNGTWKFPKKPFNVKLHSKSKILGMNKQKRWSFLANYRDRTLMRNDLVFGIGQFASGLEWTPKGQFAEVIFNGKHQGNFYISEQIRTDVNRVDIDEMKPEDIKGDNLTGGYLLELDFYYDEFNKFKSTINEWPVNIKSPDDEICTTNQYIYIQNYFNEMEDLMANGKYETLYESYIDTNSFADYYLVQTLVGNTEVASIHSVYCYKKRNEKLYAGPLWDFDLSTFSNESGITVNNAIWYKYLLKDKKFKQILKNRYLLLKPQIEKWGSSYICKQAKYLQKSTVENWKYWKIDLTYLYNRLNGDEELSYEDAVDRLISIYEARLVVLDNYIKELE